MILFPGNIEGPAVDVLEYFSKTVKCTMNKSEPERILGGYNMS